MMTSAVLFVLTTHVQQRQKSEKQKQPVAVVWLWAGGAVQSH